MKKIHILTIVCLLLAGIQSAVASGPKLGTAGAPELMIPLGAKNVAMSGANIASISGTDAIYWNPAGLAMLQGMEANFSYMNYFADMKITYLAAAAEVGRLGKFGISLQSLDIGEIQVTTIAMPEGTGETIYPDYLTFNLTYSKRFTDRINFGTNAKIISEKIHNMSASAVAFDFGLQYVTQWGVSMGVAMKNIGTSIQFDGTGIEFDSDIPWSNPNATTRKTKLDLASHELPASLTMGLAYELTMGEANALTLSGNYANNSFALDNISAGVEYGFNDLLYLRGGYVSTLYPEDYPEAAKEEQFGLSFGFGLKLNMGGNKLMFDYAHRPMELFGNVQYFSMGLSL